MIVWWLGGWCLCFGPVGQMMLFWLYFVANLYRNTLLLKTFIKKFYFSSKESKTTELLLAVGKIEFNYMCDCWKFSTQRPAVKSGTAYLNFFSDVLKQPEHFCCSPPEQTKAGGQYMPGAASRQRHSRLKPCELPALRHIFASRPASHRPADNACMAASRCDNDGWPGHAKASRDWLS